MTPYRGCTRAQRGATLIILLVMLVVVTLLAVTTVRSTAMNEKMAGNARDRDNALQVAEAVVRTCLSQINSGTFAGTVLTPVAAGASPSTPHWEVEDNWKPTASNSAAVAISGISMAESPRCMVEALGGAGSYRVTGRATGKSAETIVMLQATYTKE
jgi:type IV pilus assembly protein PilX